MSVGGVEKQSSSSGIWERPYSRTFQVDPVELVETRPSPGTGEAFEELGHREVIEAVGAVEHHALLGHRLGEILGGLGLAGASGPA